MTGEVIKVLFSQSTEALFSLDVPLRNSFTEFELRLLLRSKEIHAYSAYLSGRAP